LKTSDVIGQNRLCSQFATVSVRSTSLISLVVHLGHNGSVLPSMTTDEKLDWIMETLKRMESRQIALKTEVDDVQAHEAPTVGSFATVNTGKKA
jgi:translation initiation factor 6 (eIF-6)